MRAARHSPPARTAATPHPMRPLHQVAHLKQLNATGQPEAVVDAFERGGAAMSEGALAEYVKALVSSPFVGRPLP